MLHHYDSCAQCEETRLMIESDVHVEYLIEICHVFQSDVHVEYLIEICHVFQSDVHVEYLIEICHVEKSSKLLTLDCDRNCLA